MTRGTITIVDYNSKTDMWDVYVSPEFNGDMGPEMSSGKQLLHYFQNIFFNSSCNKSKKEKLNEIVTKMIYDFGYEDDYENFSFSNLFMHFQVPANKSGKTIIDLKRSSEDIDYSKDPWANYFNYSDWGYLINISNSNKEIAIKTTCANTDDVDDVSSSANVDVVQTLHKDTVYMLYFRNLDSVFNGDRTIHYEFPQFENNTISKDISDHSISIKSISEENGIIYLNVEVDGKSKVFIEKIS